MATLRERVTAPAHLDVPTTVGGLTFRPATVADLPEVHGVALESAAVDEPHAHPSTEDFMHRLSTEGLDPERDTVVGIDAEGHVHAYAIVIPVPTRDTAARVILGGSVRPTYRGQGIGRRVLAWQTARARQHLAGVDLDLPGAVDLTAPEGSSTLALAARAGLHPVRTWVDMQVVLDGDEREPVPATLPVLPDGLVLRAATEGDIEPMRAAKNDAFRDHWGSQPMVAADWHGYLTAEKSRLDLSRVVVDEQGDVLAFTVVESDPGAFAARGRSFGYIHWVGVVRRARGRGLAPLVVLATLDAVRDAGLSAASLDVDAENPSGAVALYERLGFVGGHATITSSMAL
jgi:mycothiol synthase